MSSRLGIALAITVVVVVLSIIGGLTMRGLVGDARAPIDIDGIDATPPIADGQFAGFTEARVAIEDRCLRVVVADQSGERSQGLRGVQDLAPYYGMLFVNPDDTDARFTMATVLIPLDVGWYDADGAPVGERTWMEPCPTGTDATCPTYGPATRYRYALETGAGGLGGGSLSGCAS
ncbi:MAG: DUF192 domain-containing protein [Actinomycetota bacterium]